MACTTITRVGDTGTADEDSIPFGMASTLVSGENYLQSAKVTAKADKQEIRGSCGSVKAVVFSKKAVDIEYVKFGKPSTTENIGTGANMELLDAGGFEDIVGKLTPGGGIDSYYIEEVSTEQTNTSATKTTVKAVGYVLA